ncbi:MAG: transglycosylase domain-containing protein [Halobacteriovoraceae bacterium]|nr:transglycosylase domain-containing protein [Halobacteriovoraceae bacterium]
MSETSNKMSLKKKLLIFSFVLDFFIIIGLIYYFGFFPRHEIEGLEKGHVQVKVDKEKNPSYKLVKKKPKNWTTLKEVDYRALHAIVVSEDWAFYQHNGYDVGQIKEAAEEALKGERTRGASTISQQVIKNLFLSPEKSLTRKGKELLYSTYMERNVSKEKILETYINIAEFGPGIYGIKAASKYYFKKNPKDLTPKEGAFLAMLLPSPVRYGESFREGELTPFAEKTIDSILDKMVRAKYLKEEQLGTAKAQAFNWKGTESEASLDKTDEKTEMAEKKKAEGSKKKRSARRKRKKRKAKDLSGKSADTAFKGGDPDLQLEENPDFDEDAINEDLSGMEAEFNVQ